MTPNPRNTPYNIHHLLPTSRGGSEDINNKVHFQVIQHKKFHGFFNHGTFSEQILQLIKLSDRALNKEVVRELHQLLRKRKKPEMFYREQVIRGEKILDRKANGIHYVHENPKVPHHILPFSRGGHEHDYNTVTLSSNTHENFCGVFGDSIFPEQILQLLLLSSSALKPIVIKEILYFMKYHKLAEFFEEDVFAELGKIVPDVEGSLVQLHFRSGKNAHEYQKTRDKIVDTLKMISEI